MGKITVVVALFLGIFMMVSCSNQAEVIKLNDKLATIPDSLYKRGVKWGTALGSDLTTKDFSNLVPIRKSIQAYVTEKETEVRNLKDVGGSETFRKSVLDFLAIEHSLTKGMESFEKLNPNSTQPELEKVGADFQEMAKQETDALASVKKEQLKFAEKNHMPIIERK